MPRYTITYKSAGAAQKVQGTTLFFAADDTKAQVVLDGLIAQSAAWSQQWNNLNSSTQTVAATTSDMSGTKEMQANILMADDSLSYIHVPGVLDSKGENDLEFVVNTMTASGRPDASGAIWLNEAGSTAEQIVRYKEVNEHLVGL